MLNHNFIFAQNRYFCLILFFIKNQNSFFFLLKILEIIFYFYQILRQIGSNTKVTCEISAPAAMGMISSRQFVTVRTTNTPTCDSDIYVSAGMSTELLDDEIQTDPTLVRFVDVSVVNILFVVQCLSQASKPQLLKQDTQVEKKK